MNISEAESAVMEVLWRHSPQAAEDIVAALTGERNWQGATIKTLINRLLKKRAIAAKKEGRRYLYSPRLERAKYVLTESTSVLDRLFDGRVAPLVAHFSQAGKLSKKDIQELKALIVEIERGR